MTLVITEIALLWSDAHTIANQGNYTIIRVCQLAKEAEASELLNYSLLSKPAREVRRWYA